METAIDTEIGVRSAGPSLSAAELGNASPVVMDGWSAFDPRPWLEGLMDPAGPVAFERELADLAVTRDDEARRADTAESGRSISDVLAAWRAAERELAALAVGDPDMGRVHAELVGLRALHHRLFDARIGAEPDRQPTTRLRILSSSLFGAPAGGVPA